MGLLNFIEHPVQTLGGLFSAPQSVQMTQGPAFDSPYGQVTPPPTFSAPTQAPAAPGPSVGGILGGLTAFPRALGGAIMNDLRSGPLATAAAQRQQAQLEQWAQQAGLTPMQRIALATNPKATGEAFSSRSAYHGVSPGEIALYGQPGDPNSVSYAAPITHAFDDRFGTYDPNSGQTSYGAARPMTEAEITARQKAESEAKAGKVIGAGGALVGADGHVIYQAPFAPRLQAVDPAKDLYQMGGPGTAPAVSVPQSLAKIFPGATVTSGLRTPQHNADVGGVPNSKHLTGNATDLVPQQGQTMAQFADQIRNSGVPLSKVIDEGDHVHVEWGGSPAPDGAPKLIKKGVPKPDAAFDPVTIDYAAQQYRTDHKMPGGSRNPAYTAAVMKRAAELATAEGSNGEADIYRSQATQERKTAVNDLGKAGPSTAGGRVQSVNALVGHVDQFEKLVDALGSGDIRVINAARQAYQRETGSAAPTNMSTVKQIMSAEVVKFISGIGGTGEDRKKLEDSIANSGSPQQLKGAMEQLREMATTQATGIRQRYDAIGATKEFDATLTPRVRQLMGIQAPPAPSGPPQKRYSPQEAAKLPKGTQFMTTDGRVLVRQ